MAVVQEMAGKISRIKTTLGSVFGILVLVGLMQITYYAPLLPDLVASHFGYQGLANGWMSRAAFIIMHLAMIIFLVLMRMLSIDFRLPQSAKYISLPHKDYWLTDDRREQTEAYIGRSFVRLSTVVLIFILVLMQLVFMANLIVPPRINEQAVWLLLILFMLYMLIWVVTFYRHFGRRS